MISRGNYVDDKKNGKYEYFYENGAKKSLEEYADDQLSSETKWYEDGQVSLAVTYKNGNYDGWYREYYPNGKLRVEQEYLDAIKQGHYRSFFEDGGKYYEGFFDKGEPKGEMKEYARDGTFKKTRTYDGKRPGPED